VSTATTCGCSATCLRAKLAVSIMGSWLSAWVHCSMYVCAVAPRNAWLISGTLIPEIAFVSCFVVQQSGDWPGILVVFGIMECWFLVHLDPVQGCKLYKSMQAIYIQNLFLRASNGRPSCAVWLWPPSTSCSGMKNCVICSLFCRRDPCPMSL
jgi:hypothetical protein